MNRREHTWSAYRRTRRALSVSLVLAFALLAMGFRRPTPGFACAQILPRALSVTASGSTSPDFIGDDSHTTTVTFEDLGSSFSPFDTVNWRGDSSSYVDVFFETPIIDFSTDPPIFGAEFAPFVRYEWPLGDADNTLMSLDPVATAISLGLPSLSQQLSYAHPTALRFYDRGECSGDTSWRAIGDAFVPQIDAAIVNVDLGHDLCNPTPHGNWDVTPILRTEFSGSSLDAFRVSRSYLVDLCNGGVATELTLTITGRFVAVSGQLRYEVESVIATSAETGPVNLTSSLGPVASMAVDTGVQSVLAQEFPGRIACTVGGAGDAACFRTLSVEVGGLGVTGLLVRNALCVADPRTRMGGACAIVPNVERVYERPEGVELVLSDYGPGDDFGHPDRKPDPLYPLLALTAGTCDEVDANGVTVYRATSTQPTGGYMGTVFEIPPQGAPLPYGDHP